MIKTLLKALTKTMVSGILAFLFLNLFSYYYYNPPKHSTNENGATDYVWEPNMFYSVAVEGFAQGKKNNEGLANAFDFDDSMKIDILFMGSSHMEGHHVCMSQLAANQISSSLKNKTVYNISVSGHTFLRCANNLRAALNRYQPTEYVVIETSNISFSNEELALAKNEEIPDIPSYDKGIIGLLQESPYFFLIYYQLGQNIGQIIGQNNIQKAADMEVEMNNEELLDDLLQKMSALAGEYGAKIIIMYHPHIMIAYDGMASLDTDQDIIDQFKRSCDNNGILFLDMSDRFIKEYERSHILPHGFSNSPVGKGHLNKYGHAMIAEELYKMILEEDQ